MVREWYPGFKGKTSKGEFTVIRQAPGGYLVEYTSGAWEGKAIVMPRELGAKTHEIEDLRLPKEQKEELLDVFYDEFPKEFDNLYNYLYRVTGKDPTTAGMIAILREEYPPLFQIALSKFFNHKKD